MELDRLSRAEWIAVAGGLLLALTVFLPWYATSGNPNAQIGLQIGSFLAVVGIVAMMVGGAMRATETERVRKPPGVL